ncbi:HPP family protein [Hyphomonas sp. WL0036]|uniref:HPP family protein n=1 Tax=Hyphomonas sediminis TaxID=2866160 RepID=UPI001C81CED3|nr:HPP family protein [Hyphomonas sediminis]MBY9067275.1 HPP family protein [Hyphomonas sediminis]
MARPRFVEAVRAGAGAGLALALSGFLLLSVHHQLATDLPHGLLLIAPLGASAFLLFAVPNSPLAQPWSAIVGNTASALIAITAILSGLPQLAAVGVAITGSILAMAMLRAMHPPGAAVALATVLSEQMVHDLGYSFALAPVLLDTSLLVVLAIVWNRLTGRVYPFRQPGEANTHGTRDRPPQSRLGLSPEALAGILERYRLSANIGTEDFGRLLAEAETEAARLHVGGLTCGEIMSKDLTTVTPQTRLRDVAELFRRHRFKTLPVTGPQGQLLGVITQNDLIQRARDAAILNQSGFARSLSGLLLARRGAPHHAEEIMSPPGDTVAPGESIGILVRLLADGGVQAVPVVAPDGSLAGIVTRSDLLAALAHMPLWRPPN